MKVRTLLVAAAMFSALSAAAFAQATFTVGSSPVTAVIQNGYAEKTGDITFTVVSGVTAAGTIEIVYDVDVTRIPSNADIYTSNVGVAGHWTAGATVNPTASAVAKTVVINVPAGGIQGDVIRVTGVRVAIAGSGIVNQNVSAQISTTLNLITAGQTDVRVIATEKPAIVATATSASVNAVSGVVTGAASMTATEVFLNAFGGAAENGNVGPAAGVPGALMVRFTLTPPPAGMTLSFPQTIGDFEAADANGNPLGAAPTPITSTTTPPLSVYYKVATDTDAQALESLTVPITIAGAGPFVGAASVSFQATVAPIGTLSGTGTSTLIPRYAEDLTPAKELITFTGASTAMLVPYASIVIDPLPENTYDTGIAISNTTKDPGSTAMGYTSATPQPGGFTVYFFPQNGTAFSVSSSAARLQSESTGLDPTGKIPAGGTFVALLSALVRAAQDANPSLTIPDEYTGYLIVVTNFTNAHGLATISNFKGYTQASPVLIIDASRKTELGLKP